MERYVRLSENELKEVLEMLRELQRWVFGEKRLKVAKLIHDLSVKEVRWDEEDSNSRNLGTISLS